MNSPVRIGLVGIGGYGQRHLSSLFSLQAGGFCQLAAIADPFASRFAGSVAALRAQNVTIYDDLEAMLSQDEVDVCIIATPIPLHVPQTLAALGAGKHVYLEKPPCVTIEEWSQLCAAEQSAGKRCAVGFQMQTTPAMRFVNAQIAAGTIGKLETVSASVGWQRTDEYYNRSGWAGQWKDEGRPVFDGPATNALAHVVHASLFLSGAQKDDWGCIARVRGCLKKARPIESYDAAFLEAETERGVLVRLAFCHATARQDEVVVHCAGTGGTAEVEWNGTVRLTRSGEQTRQYNFFCDSHFASMLNFLRTLHEPAARPATTLKDCLPYLQIVNGALQSSGGASLFDCELVTYVGEGAPGAYFIVDGLDAQFAAFAANPQQAPSFLSPGPWIAADKIAPYLAVS